MRPLVLLVSLGLVLFAECHASSDSSSSSSSSSEEDDDEHGGCQSGRAALAASRIDSMSFRLERLANKIEKMQGRVSEVDEADETNHIISLSAQLSRLEGGGCEEGEFRCGTSDSQCVNSLLVCDGVDDCDNHNDESEETCKPLTRSGDRFEGHVRWEACKANPDADITLVITRNKVVDYFQPRVWISASVRLDYDENHRHVQFANTHEGFYNFGLRRLVVQPSDGDHIGAVCDFFTDDLADCTIMEAGTLNDCAHVRVHRVQ